MKKILSIGFILLIYSSQSLASGCGGDGWKLERINAVGSKFIQGIQGYRGISAWVTRHEATAKLSFMRFSDSPDNVREIEFVSDRFDPNTLAVADVLRLLDALPVVTEVKVMERVERNYYYDDCHEIPENTDRITTFYQFQLQTESGKNLRFILWGDIRYIPELPK